MKSEKHSKNKIITTIFNYLIRKILSIDSKDTQAGFKFVNKNEFLNCTEFISSGFEYDIELFYLQKNVLKPTQLTPLN